MDTNYPQFPKSSGYIIKGFTCETKKILLIHRLRFDYKFY